MIKKIKLGKYTNLFVNKDKYGISHISSLSLLNGVRKNDIFSKKYLKGLYVDVPNINE